MVMDDLQELRNGSPHQPKSEFSRVIDFLKESLRNCREMYLSLRDSLVILEPFVTLPLYTVLGSDDEYYDVVCYFILFLSNQLDSNFIWEKYGIDRSGRVKGVDTTYNIRLEEFIEFEETQYLREKFSSYIETQNKTVSLAPPSNAVFAQKCKYILTN